MEILVNAASLTPPVTGIGRYTYNLMYEMEQILDVEFTYLYNTRWSKELVSSKASVLPVGRLKKLFKKVIPNPYVVARWVKQYSFDSFVRSNNAVLYHEPNYLPLDFAGPIVVTIHDLSVVRFPEAHPADRVEQFQRMLPAVIDRADAIVVDSDFIRNELIELFSVKSEKVFTTLLGVGGDFRPYDSTEMADTLAKFKLHENGYLLVVGTLEPRKNLPLILESYQQLSAELREKYPLVIAGMRGWNLDQFSAGLKKLVRDGQVRLLGYVEDNELPMIFSGAKTFLFPSKYEGFGLPPLEAMASGVPVIASNRASIPEVVGDAGILLEPDDVAGWTETMTRLLNDEEECNRLRDAGLQRSKSFTWRRCAEQTITAYEYALDYSLPRRQ